MDFYNETLTDKKKARKQFSKIGLAASAMILLMAVVPYIIYLLAERYAKEIISTDWFLLTASAVPMYLAAVPIFLLLVRKLPKAAPPKNTMRPGQWFALVAVAAAFIYGGNLISGFLMAALGKLTGNTPDNKVMEMLSSSNLLANLIIAGIIGPVVEELVFRKTVIDRTRAYGEKTAIFFSAVMFALFHGNFYQFFYAFALGLVLGYIYMRTGKIRNTIFLHMGINLISGVLTTWLVQNIREKLPDSVISGTFQSTLDGLTDEEKITAFIRAVEPALPYLAGILAYAFLVINLAIIGLVLFIVGMNKKKIIFGKTDHELPPEDVGGVVYMNVGVVAMITICLVIMVWSLF